MNHHDILQWIASSLQRWPEAAARHRDVAECSVRTIVTTPGGFEWRVRLLPARKVSTLASIDKGTIAARPCFLCQPNRPAEQEWHDFGDYQILVNPFPIFPNHLTIAARNHTPQLMQGRVADMARLARELQGFTVIYNGATSGASAPDHFHFQAIPSEHIDMALYGASGVASLRFTASTPEELAEAIEPIVVPRADGSELPMNMAVMASADGQLTALLVPRRAHRPECYPHPAISPGAIDMFGTIVTVNSDDFEAVTPDLLSTVMTQVAYPAPIDPIRVGIMTVESEPSYELHGDYLRVGDTFIALTPDACFSLESVPVGIQFHWQFNERRTYPGSFELLSHTDGTVTVVNTVDIERYVEGVIGAEMNADSPDELLKAHAVISRSWACKQIEIHRAGHLSDATHTLSHEAEDEHIKWYDHDDHTLFDVCADDHCQRYLGIPAEHHAAKLRALVEATSRQVMMSREGALCDTRFSKCCGGAFEEFEACWEPVHHSYLEAALDRTPSLPMPDLTQESAAREWILSAPEAYCAAPDVKVLRAVLNRSDLDTTPDFYRWQVVYTPEELSTIVRDRSGIDFGTITSLTPLERGKSGRIVRLHIEGTLRSMVVGKELEIRRWLSTSHLYSSAFVVDRGTGGEFVLRGAGWGHGVGLCQIGAAVMASRGMDYRTILTHYFRNASIVRR